MVWQKTTKNNNGPQYGCEEKDGMEHYVKKYHRIEQLMNGFLIVTTARASSFFFVQIAWIKLNILRSKKSHEK
jgi:hypothetical protein